MAALKPDYERLEQATGNQLPFATYEWQLAWCRHFLNHDPNIHETPQFHVMRNEHGACVAILPFIMSDRRIGPLKVVSMGPVGADQGLSEIRTPLIERGYEQRTARTAREALARQPGWDWIHWIHVDRQLGNALSAGRDLVWQPRLADFVLDLPSTWEEFRAGLKRNIRESLRHCYNSLRRDGHVFDLQVIEEPAAVRANLARYFELHRMRADAPDKPPHPDRFASVWAREFLYAVCEQMASRRGVRLFALRIHGEVVAMRLAFALGDSLYLYYSGFDPRWWRYGVMTTTVAEAIKYAIRNGFRTINLSPGADMSKTRWSPRQIDYGSAFELRERLRSRLANRAYVKLRALQPSPLLRTFFAARRWN
jgi:CelD/BcsL family acetyltransferase involved in cellulose biosynthesis